MINFDFNELWDSVISFYHSTIRLQKNNFFKVTVFLDCAKERCRAFVLALHLFPNSEHLKSPKLKTQETIHDATAYATDTIDYQGHEPRWLSALSETQGLSIKIGGQEESEPRHWRRAGIPRILKIHHYELYDLLTSPSSQMNQSDTNLSKHDQSALPLSTPGADFRHQSRDQECPATINLVSDPST